MDFTRVLSGEPPWKSINQLTSKYMAHAMNSVWQFLGSNTCGGLGPWRIHAYSRFHSQVCPRNRGAAYDSKMTPTHGYLKLQLNENSNKNLTDSNKNCRIPNRYPNNDPPQRCQNSEQNSSKCLHRLCEFQLNSSLVDWSTRQLPGQLGEGETHDGIKWKLWLMGENFG